MKKDSLIKIIILVFLFSSFVVIFLLDNYSKKQRELFLKSKTERKTANNLPTKNPTVSKNIITENITLSIDDDKFTPEILHVNKGETIKITLVGKEGYHNFILEPFSVVSANVMEGKSTKFYFVATESGRFTFYSNTGRYNDTEPKGLIVVE